MNPAEYDRGWETEWEDMKKYGPFSRHLRRLIKNLIRPLHFETVLDVGCGQGSLLGEIKSHFPHVKTTGIDISPTAVDLARRQAPEGEFHVGDLIRQPLDNKFDLVICSEVLEHIADDLQVSHRLRPPGGHAPL
jgi:2-polyprenyl-3-methyl-5-hydroxy-6-metoxy-1,4-benzoquinol methylase